jgi:N-dimethylarginine dimethylaminohydrolase
VTLVTELPIPAATAPSSRTRRYLMCPPRYFEVGYAINPWMDVRAPVDVELAGRQWSRLKDTYESLGHQVEVIEPEPGLPDMVFAANGALVIGDRALGARFRHPQRSAEAPAYRAFLAATTGVSQVVQPQHDNEGEGDFLVVGDLVLAGTGYRTAPAAHTEAEQVFGLPFVSLTLVDPRYYHLDTALAVLDDRTVAYFPDAFSIGSQQVLRALFPDALIASAQDAAVLGLNAVSDGLNVVLPRQAESLAQQLRERGYRPVGVDLSELLKAGGSVKCCTLELHRHASIPTDERP